MRSPPGSSVSAARAKRAALVVGLLLAGAPLSGIVSDAQRPGVVGEAMRAGLWEEGAGGDALGVEEALAVGRGSDALPEGLERELGIPAERAEVRVEELAGGGVVGFVVATAADEAYARVRDGMVAKGWAAVESGQARCGSFAKSDGAYRWAFASCTEAGGLTSVVVQYATADEGS